MVRSLSPAPPDLGTRAAPRTGSFRGGLPRLDLGPWASGHGGLWRIAHEKRWSYAAACDERVLVGMAVVRTGYAAKAFAFALDRRSGRKLADVSLIAPPSAARFDDAGFGRRRAELRFGRSRVVVGDDELALDCEAGGRPFYVAATAAGSRRARETTVPALSAVVPIPGGVANATEKRLSEVDGEVVAGGERFLLAGAPAAWDHTAGLLARRTTWRWALGLGRVRGRRVAFNLVEGFVGEPECGGWLGDSLHPFGEARFRYDPARPLDPWSVTTTCGAVDLRFTPAAMHAETTNLGLVRSRFVQPLGAFQGTLRFGAETVSVDALAGVTEHQDVVW